MTHRAFPVSHRTLPIRQPRRSLSVISWFNWLTNPRRTLLAGVLLCCLLPGPVLALPPASPQRVVSINLCTDQYLLLLADPAQIQSISHLARHPTFSYYADRAQAYPANNASPEQVIRYRPDLILADQFSHRASSQLLQRLGFNVARFPHPQSLAQVQQQLLQLGTLLGQPMRARQIVQQMEQQLAQLQATADRDSSAIVRPSLLPYAPGSFTQGPQTLTGDILQRAGWHNAAAELGITHYGRLDLEQLLQLAPLALIDVPTSTDSRSVAEQLLQHPVLKQAARPRYRLTLAPRLWSCGGPMLIEAIQQLRAERIRIEQLEQRPATDPTTLQEP